MRGFPNRTGQQEKQEGFLRDFKISKDYGKHKYDIVHSKSFLNFYFNGVSELIPVNPTELNNKKDKNK